MARMDEAITQVRRHFDLAPSEAAVYVRLCVAGPARASDLSDALHMHRNEVYRTAERLEARGLVRATLDRPARFMAVEPREAFESALAGRLQAVDALRRTREEIATLIAHVEPAAAEPPKNIYKVVRGRREIYQIRRQLVEGATRSIDWVSTHPLALPLSEQAGERALFERRAADGVALRALLPADPAPGAFAGEARAFAEKGLVRFLLVDDRELLMFVVNDPTASPDAAAEVAIHTNAPGFVQAQRLFFDQAWGSSQ
jgi:sugar-specific transcriptional regulator TrmB